MMRDHTGPNPGDRPEPSVPQSDRLNDAGLPRSENLTQLPAQPVSESAPQPSVSFTPNASDRLPDSARQYLPERHLDNLQSGSPWTRRPAGGGKS